ncbi:MAG: type B DNA-directed DNA polymerase, partial [Thermoplasmata archaeon]
INSSSFIYRESGINGIIEISRMSRLPPLQASIITPGTAVSSMEEADAIAEDILIPAKKDDNEGEKNTQELIASDRGGMVLQPQPGIYENVYEIDFSSMYPSIIVEYGLSIGNGHFLSRSLKKLLEKRLLYKKIDSRSETYHNRNTALKWMLLTSFGYTGYKNAKFGKIEIHEKITGTGRKILADAIRISQENGFEIIHGIVDSLWIKGDGNINNVLSEIKRTTRIDIVVSGHYKWIVFLPERGGLGSPSRYFGLGYDGKYKVRGIDLRRNDVPQLSKKFQIDALKILEGCNNELDLYSKYKEIKNLESRYIRNMRKFPPDDFTVEMKVSRYPEYYATNTINKHVIEKYIKDNETHPGNTIRYIVSDHARKIVGFGNNTSIDYAFYMRYLTRAFEPFDFIYKNVVRKSRLEDFQPFL